jgi:hypothetical protein
MYISNEERAACEAASGAHTAPRAFPETNAARVEREHREEQDRLKADATARFQSERQTQDREAREKIEREDADRRAVERAALEEHLRVVFFKTDAATEADWLMLKDELVRDELRRATQQRLDDDRHAQQANIAGML